MMMQDDFRQLHEQKTEDTKRFLITAMKKKNDMPIIKIQITIKAEKKIVFDLSRSIDLHKISTQQTNEEAIAGVTSGLIGIKIQSSLFQYLQR